ncbi:hypothetical protein ACOSQ2_030973 [Xanthoceras sorbifolium]
MADGVQLWGSSDQNIGGNGGDKSRGLTNTTIPQVSVKGNEKIVADTVQDSSVTQIGKGADSPSEICGSDSRVVSTKETLVVNEEVAPQQLDHSATCVKVECGPNVQHQSTSPPDLALPPPTSHPRRSLALSSSSLRRQPPHLTISVAADFLSPQIHLSSRHLSPQIHLAISVAPRHLCCSRFSLAADSSVISPRRHLSPQIFSRRRFTSPSLLLLALCHRSPQIHGSLRVHCRK